MLFSSSQVNDQTRQDGNTEDMIFPIPQLIEHVSSIMTLQAGDLLLTGTPKGVGSVQAGQTMHAGLESGSKILAELRLNVKDREGLFEFNKFKQA